MPGAAVYGIRSRFEMACSTQVAHVKSELPGKVGPGVVFAKYKL